MKIAFFAGPNGFTFLNNIINYFSNKYDVKVFNAPVNLIIQGSPILKDVFDLMKWSDISWFEWCEPPLYYASQFPKVCYNVVRLHRYEAYTHQPNFVNWNNVDVLIFVSHFPKEVFFKRFEIPSTIKTHIIPNAINLSDFNVDLKEKKRL